MASLLVKKPDLGGYEDYLGYDIPFSGPMPLIAKQALLPIVTKPIQGKWSENLLKRIFDLIPEDLYKRVNRVRVVDDLPWLGSHDISTGNIDILRPDVLGHSPREYVDTTVHEVLHNMIKPLKLSRDVEEDAVARLARKYMDYADTMQVKPELQRFHEGLGSPPPDLKSIRSLLREVFPEILK